LAASAKGGLSDESACAGRGGCYSLVTSGTALGWFCFSTR
jgi:hypothetical protein